LYTCNDNNSVIIINNNMHYYSCRHTVCTIEHDRTSLAFRLQHNQT